MLRLARLKVVAQQADRVPEMGIHPMLGTNRRRIRIAWRWGIEGGQDAGDNPESGKKKKDP
jgi:hypothetical protein